MKQGRDSKRPFYIVLAVILIAGITALSYMAARPRQNVSLVDTTLPPVPNTGHALGRDNAPVEVVEFADFECPACGSFATLTEPDVRSRLVNTGIVHYRFMDYPLSMHRNTWPAHRAAWCAGDQNKFWEMHDALFFNQDRWNGEATSRPDGVIAQLAQGLGLNMSQFNSCVESRKYDPQIRANQAEAERRQVQSTPTFEIGQKRVTSAISYDEFKRHVDDALAAKSAAATTTTPATKTK
ncbi:MAG TPA: DsbA family protein [Gemmatimonadaceae bacterium]|nr:DsbA family protein [Gemmatimonadaceae bacterium]